MPAITPPLRWFFLGSIALSLLVAWDLAVPLSMGAVLAFVSERPIDWLLRRVHRRDSVTARWAVTSAFVLAVFLGFLLPIALALYVAVHDLLRLIATRDLEEWLNVFQRVVDRLSELLSRVGIELPAEQLTSRGTEFVTSNVGYVGSTLAAALSATPTALFNGSVVVVAWVTLAVEGAEARARVLPKLLPWKRERELITRITAEVIEGVIVSNVMVSVVQATLCAIALLVLRVPRALVWGVLAFFLSFVPVLGTTVVTLGAAAYLLSQGRVGAAIAMAVVAVIVATVDNVLRPLLMRSSSDLSFLWVLVAFVGGVSFFGLPGVVLGPLAFSLFAGFLAALDEVDPPESG
jgi:predicted PurR-regulated permease PerM